MMIGVETLQLIAGIGKPILEETGQLQCLPKGWVTTLREFLNFANATIEITNAWIPALQRQNDIHIMDAMLQHKWTRGDLIKFQMCRMYLQVCSLTCITTIKGDKLEDWALSGEQPDDRRSPWLWPRTEKPPTTFWTVWRRMLRSTVIVPGGDELRQPIGDWISQPQQEWLHTYDTENNLLIENFSKDKVRN